MHFPAARNKLLGAGVTFFASLWTAIVVGMFVYLGGVVETVLLSEVDDFESYVKTQSEGAEGTAYHAIALHTKGGGRVLIGEGIANQQELRWLMGEVRRLAGVDE